MTTRTRIIVWLIAPTVATGIFAATSYARKSAIAKVPRSAVAVSTLPAQDIPVHQIDQPDATAPEVFSLIQGIRELSDGRVLVTDWIEERLVVIDFDAGTERDIGGVGSGPHEFRLPRQLVALPGDSTLLVDVGNARLAIISPDLEFARTISAHAHGERFGMNPRAADAEGALYFSLSPWASGFEAGRSDSVAVGKWHQGDPQMQVLDVQLKTSTSRGPRMSLQFSIPFVMFAKQDTWALAADGALAIVRSEPYQVDWYTLEDGMQEGSPIEYDEIPISMEDRRDYVRQFLQSTPQSGRGEEGGMGHTPAEQQSEREVNRMAESEVFAETFPPFEPGRVWASKDGTLWVKRSLPLGTPPTFDVFDRAGERIAIVTLPRDRELLGLGVGHAYATVADEFDLLTLERYPIPVMSSRR